MTKRMTIAALSLCGVFLSTYLSLYKLVCTVSQPPVPQAITPM